MIHVGINLAGMTKSFLSKAFETEMQNFEKYYGDIKYRAVLLSDGMGIRTTWKDKLVDKDPLGKAMYYELINDIFHGLYLDTCDRRDQKCQGRKEKTFEFHEDYIRQYAKTWP